MSDWKTGLQRAAEELALNAKTKAQEVARSAGPLASETKKAAIVQSSRRAIPEAPNELSGRDSAKKYAKANKAFTRAIPHSGKYGSHSPPKSIRKQPALPVPVRRPAEVRDRAGSASPPLAGVPTVKAVAVAQEPRFEMPDISRYAIRHGSSASLQDQSWHETGIQMPVGGNEIRGRAQCVVGLDFGTAFTKACVQFRQSSYIVHWDGAVSHSSSFVLPGIFSIRRDDTCVLGMEPEAQICSDLKMGLLTQSEPNRKILAVAFLALVTRYIRWWLFTTHQSVFSGFQIEWFVNVGLPAVPWDNLALRKLYEEITVAAWRLGASDDPIKLSLAASSLGTVQKDLALRPGQMHRGRVCAFPEFVAQINSYRRSAQRRRDLHLLLDIGAGTIDIVTFHAWEPEEGDCYSILEADVKHMGTHFLLAHRAVAAGLTDTHFDEALSRLSVKEFEAKFGLFPGKLRSAQRVFADEIRWFLEKVLRRTREARYATSPRWHEGIPFFVAGGGHRVDAYRQAIDDIGKNWRLEEISLPVPEAMVWGRLPRTEFHRVSVAYGLSDSAENIGLIERRSEVPDLYRTHAAGVGHSERYIEK